MSDDNELREQLADFMHQAWAHWTQDMLDTIQAEQDERSPEPTDICELLCNERWRRQIETPYVDLSEKEKDSNREWADKVLALAEEEKTRKLERLDEGECDHDFQVVGGQPGSFTSECSKCGAVEIGD